MNTNSILLVIILVCQPAIGYILMTLAEAIQANQTAIQNLANAVDAVPAKIAAAGDLAPAVQAIEDITTAVQAQAEKLAGM